MINIGRAASTDLTISRTKRRMLSGGSFRAHQTCFQVLCSAIRAAARHSFLWQGTLAGPPRQQHPIAEARSTPWYCRGERTAKPADRFRLDPISPKHLKSCSECRRENCQGLFQRAILSLNRASPSLAPSSRAEPAFILQHDCCRSRKSQARGTIDRTAHAPL